MSRDGALASSLTLGDAWRALLRSIPFATLCALAIGALTFMASTRLPSVFESTAILVLPRTGSTSAIQTEHYQPSALGIESYTTLANSLSLRTQAGLALGGEPLRTDDLSIRAGSSLQTDVINVTARGASAQEAAQRANALAESLIAWDAERVREEASAVAAVLREQAAVLSASPEAGDVNIPASVRLSEATLLASGVFANLSPIVLAERAVPDPEPVSPQPVLWTAIAAVAAGLLTLGISLIRAALDDRLTNPLAAAQVSGLRVLAEVPAPSRGQAPYFRSLSILATHVRPSAAGETSVVLFTSPDDRPGRAVTAVGLAAWLASNGFNTTLIDANIERAEATRLLRLKRGASFDQMLSRPHDGSLKPISLRVGRHGAPLRIVPSFGSDPEIQVDVSEATAVLSRLSETSEVILIDTPPLASSDVFVLANIASATLLVATLHKTRARDLREHVEACERAGLEITGLVLVREDRQPVLALRRSRLPVQVVSEAPQGV